MSATSAAYYPPVAVFQQAYMTRLVQTEFQSESPAAFHWDILASRMPHVVNDVLVSLDCALADLLPGVITRSGSATVRDRFSHVYHTYSNDAGATDTVVVGLVMECSDISVTIRGDIVSEETGRVFFETTSTSFADGDAKILEEVKSTAKRLLSQTDVVTQAIAAL